jgi:hypothetical protein
LAVRRVLSSSKVVTFQGGDAMERDSLPPTDSTDAGPVPDAGPTPDALPIPPDAGPGPDAGPATQPADPLLLFDDTPCIPGKHPDGTPWTMMAWKPADPAPAPQRPASVAELREWFMLRRSRLLECDPGVLKVWPDTIGDLLNAARALGLNPPPMPFPIDFTDPQDGLGNIDVLLRWLDGLKGPAKSDVPADEWLADPNVPVSPTTDAPPMSDREREVYACIRDNGPVTGKQIETHLGAEPKTLDRPIRQLLKYHGVKNRRNVGYYIGPSE